MTAKSQTEKPGALRQIVNVDAHTLAADVAVDAGGGGTAPGPHDYFDIALATCKALTVSVYARTKAYPLDTVTVEVTRDASREKEGHYALAAKLTFGGALTEEQKARLFEISTRCPIHKLMTTSEITIESSRG